MPTIILAQLASGVERKRVGLLAKDRVPVRDGAQILDAHENVVGQVTSGSFGPTLDGPVAMGYVEIAHAKLGALLQANVRGKAVPIEVTKTPFITLRYYRS